MPLTTGRPVVYSSGRFRRRTRGGGYECALPCSRWILGKKTRVDQQEESTHLSMDGYGRGQFTLSGEEEEREFLDLYAEELVWGDGFSAKASVRFYLLERMTHPVSAYFFDLDTTFVDPHIYFGPAVKKAQVGIILATLRRFYPKSTPEEHFTAFVADTSHYDETLAAASKTVSGVRAAEGGEGEKKGQEGDVVAVYVLKPAVGLDSKLQKGAWIEATFERGKRYRLAEDAGEPAKGKEMLVLWLVSSPSSPSRVKPGEYRLCTTGSASSSSSSSTPDCTFRVQLPSANVHVQRKGEIHRSSKMHVIFPNILVTHEQAMQIDFAIASVFQSVMSTLPEMDKGWSDACDYRVHSKSGSLRMIGSSKCGKAGTERVNLGRVYRLRWVIGLKKGRRTELVDHPALTNVYEMVRVCSIRRPGAKRPVPDGWAPYPGCPRLALTESERALSASGQTTRKRKSAQGKKQQLRQTPEEKELSKRQRFSWKKDLPPAVVEEITRIVHEFHPVYKRVRCYIECNGSRTRYRVRLRGMGSNACLNLRSDSQDLVARLQRELLHARQGKRGDVHIRTLEERLNTARAKARPGFHKNQTAYFVIEADGATQMCWCNCATTNHRLHGPCGGGCDRQLVGRRYVFNPGFRSKKRRSRPSRSRCCSRSSTTCASTRCRMSTCYRTDRARARHLPSAWRTTFLYSATSAILTARSRLRYAHAGAAPPMPPSSSPFSRRAHMPNALYAVFIRLHLHAVFPRAEQKSVRYIAILVLVIVHSFFFSSLFFCNRGQFIDRKRLKTRGGFWGE